MTAYIEWLAEHFRSEADEDRMIATEATRHVLGYATGYGVAQVAPFVLSLRTHFDGEVFLVVDPEPEMLAFLATHRIHALRAPKKPGWRPHVAVERLAAFEAVLERLPEGSVALLTDVRDVLFQGDPLTPAPMAIEAFEEAGSCGGHRFNMKYITALVGPAMAGLIRDQPALCVGTVVGPIRDLARLCRTMLMLSARPRSSLGGAFGADQAAFNIAAHLDLVPIQRRANFSRVATVGLVEGRQLRLDAGRILNPDGGASPIVHQYDRHEHLHAHVRRRWSINLPPRRQAPARPMADRLERFARSFGRRIPELR